MSKQKPKAVVLMSGGLDSTTVAAIARSRGFDRYAITVAYGQRHSAEIDVARRLVAGQGFADHKVLNVNMDLIGGSALTDSAIDVPDSGSQGIPVTYVPARNTLFLSLALGWAEVIGAKDIFIGVNAVDYSGYPDCRPTFIEAFERLAAVATKAGVEGNGPKIHAPLISLSKAEIIEWGLKLGVDYAETVSCYRADHLARACGRCDACRLRSDAFSELGIADPTRYFS